MDPLEVIKRRISETDGGWGDETGGGQRLGENGQFGLQRQQAICAGRHHSLGRFRRNDLMIAGQA